MSVNVNEKQTATAVEAPQIDETVEEGSAQGVPKKLTAGRTVCNERNEKNKLCNGHLKQLRTGGEEAEMHLRGDDVLFKCQSCGALYMGPPLGHVRDPFKQQRFVERELSAILQAAGGTLPVIKKNDKGVYVMIEAGQEAAHAPVKTATTAPTPTPSKTATPATVKPAAPPSASTQTVPPPVANVGPVAGETPEQKRERLQAMVTAAKARKEALEGCEGAAPAASATTQKEATAQAAQPVASKAQTAPPPLPNAGPVPGETHEQKIERLRALVAAAKARQEALEGGAEATNEASTAQAATRTTPTAATTSGLDSSAEADAHREAAEAQAATGMASATPLSSAAATASPTAGAEKVEDLAPDTLEETTQPATKASAQTGTGQGKRADFDTGPVPGETHEEKIARLRAVVARAKELAEG
ncbi:MAG TPA: hypothetical protein VGB17_19335 [Pyrinomonadaceae bacterium]|jgi:hypothetical protein